MLWSCRAVEKNSQQGRSTCATWWGARIGQGFMLGSRCTCALQGKRKPASKESEGEEAAGGSKAKGGEALQQQVLNWAALFSRAANELQYMGVVRPSKRRCERSVQVMFQAQDLEGF